jgi:hypothetical protein
MVEVRIGLADRRLNAQKSLLLIGGVVDPDRDRYPALPARRGFPALRVHIAVRFQCRPQPIREPAQFARGPFRPDLDLHDRKLLVPDADGRTFNAVRSANSQEPSNRCGRRTCASKTLPGGREETPGGSPRTRKPAVAGCLEGGRSRIRTWDLFLIREAL